MNISISTNMKLSHLRPKNMRELYSNHTVTLCRKGNVCHLLWGVMDWAEAEARYGEAIAEFDPHRGYWLTPRFFFRTIEDRRLTQKELVALIGTNEICAMGKDCWKHACC